ncbi:MAG: hypothetical protein MUF70_02515 [Myxococcota bacterium]|nr:hypothetical protein [Myxococcota bacterium]
MRRASRSARMLAVAIAALFAVACAGRGPALRGDVYRDPAQGWTIGVPAGAWQRAKAEGADLALLRADGAAMSVTSRCDGADAPPAMLARQLRPDRATRPRDKMKKLEIAGAPTRRQRFETERDGRRLHITTLTRVAPPCIQDFVLVAPEAADDAESVFDAWAKSFEPGSGP